MPQPLRNGLLPDASLPLPPATRSVLRRAARALLTALPGLWLAGCPASEPPPGPAAGSPETSPTSSLSETDGADGGWNLPEPALGTGTPDELRALEVPELSFVPCSEGLPVQGSWRGYPDLIDFDGDGRAEVVVSNREEDGWNLWTFVPGGEGRAFEAGAWEKRHTGLPRDLQYGGQDGFDVDHDGDIDLVLSSHAQGLRVFRNAGELTWDQVLPPPRTVTLILDLCGANLNGDEHRDVAGIGHFKGGVNLYLGDGKGGFTLLDESRDLMGFEKAFGMQIEAADFDDNGLDDLIVAAENGVRAFFTSVDANGKPSWTEHSLGLPETKTIGNILRGLAIADFVEGGLPEVAFGSLYDPGQREEDRRTMGVYSYDPATQRWTARDSGLLDKVNAFDVRAADFDQDGHVDLLACVQTLGGVLFLGDGKGGFRLAGQIKAILPKSDLAVGDVDGDGRPDIAASVGGQKGGRPGSVNVFLNRAEAFAAR